jgi:hypothetical protein
MLKNRVYSSPKWSKKSIGYSHFIIIFPVEIMLPSHGFSRNSPGLARRGPKTWLEAWLVIGLEIRRFWHFFAGKNEM